MICLKICTFVVSKTTATEIGSSIDVLWFAWKSVPLWYLKQLNNLRGLTPSVVICLKICTFVVSKTTNFCVTHPITPLWFAWKSVPLWYLKQPLATYPCQRMVVICLKICTFVVSKTTYRDSIKFPLTLWFAWKSVPLWYLKQLMLFNLLANNKI